MIMCPYCLTMQEPQATSLCNNPECGRKLPPRYVDYARKGQITSLGTFGLPQHGKTALLSSLMEAAQGASKIVPGSFVSPLGDETHKILNEWRARFSSGAVNLPSTPPNERPLPLLVHNHKFLGGQSMLLVAYDLAGEALVNAGSTPELVRALSKVNTIWCVVSLDDLINKNEQGYDLAGLFTTYLEAMTSLHIPIKGKNILVVYTKADILLGIRQGLAPLPDEILLYLGDDPYKQIRQQRSADLPPFDEEAYFARMCEISEILREYTMDFVPGGGAFVNMVGEEQASVFFTINSAFGGALDAGNAKMGFAVQARRVLDTLIWAIKLDRRVSSDQQIALIVPAVIQDAGLASQETIRRFYEELSAGGGHVATYYPGQVQPAFPVGTAPTVVPTPGVLDLVCPLLDGLPPETTVVLLVDQRWPLDFRDLAGTRRAERLLLVAGQRELVATWLPHHQVYLHDGEIPRVVSGFLQRLAASKVGGA
ncbi:MAG TPA: hypothetical protein VGF67_06645 [Ktedonobacteraceae bacterium]